MEEMCLKKIDGAIRAIKLGTKRPEDTDVGKLLNRLKPLNEGMYQEKLNEYMLVKQEYDKKQQNK